MQNRTKPRRWLFWDCFQGENREKEAAEAIKYLENKGFKAKIWAPRPEHKTSGHIHVVVLCTLPELRKLGGV